jgi:hypothetical protein
MPLAAGIYYQIATDDFGVSFLWEGLPGFRHARYDAGDDNVHIYGCRTADDDWVLLASLYLTGRRHAAPEAEADELTAVYIREETRRADRADGG